MCVYLYMYVTKCPWTWYRYTVQWDGCTRYSITQSVEWTSVQYCTSSRL